MAERVFNYLAYLREIQEYSVTSRGMILAGLVTGGSGLAVERFIHRPLRRTLLDKPLAVIFRGALLIGIGLVGLGVAREVTLWQTLDEISKINEVLRNTQRV